MRMEEIRERGRTLGVAGSRMRKAEMIRAIQVKEGNQGCFGAPWRFECQQVQCCWRADCMTPSPVKRESTEQEQFNPGPG